MNRTIYIKIGVIVSLTLFSLIWGVNYLKSKGMFSNDKTYYVVYDRVDGLEVSNPVLINGFAVGQVRDIRLMPDLSGRLLVELAVKGDYKIPGKSVARIFSSDLMGTKAIGIIFGDANYMQQSGDTLIADFEGSIQEMVSVQMLPIKNKAEDLLKQMEDAIEMVNLIFNKETQENIRSSVESMKHTFDNLNNSTTNLDSIVTEGKDEMQEILIHVNAITANLEKNSDNISETMSNLASITDSLSESDLKQMINETNQLMSELAQIAEKINQSQGTVGQLVNNDTLYFYLEDVTYNLNRLLEDLRLNPKRYVQFSAMNFGKTVYVQDNEEIEKHIKKEKVSYWILIKESNKPILIKPENFKNYKNIVEEISEGTYIYLLGPKKNIESAKSLFKDVQQDFPDAKIVEYRNGSYNEVINY